MGCGQRKEGVYCIREGEGMKDGMAMLRVEERGGDEREQVVGGWTVHGGEWWKWVH